MVTEMGHALDEFVDTPRRMLRIRRADLERLPHEEIEAFRLKAARALLARQADRIPVVREKLGARTPEDITDLNDLVGLLLRPDEYKSYDEQWLRDADFAALTEWMGRFTAHDYSGLDMSGCTSITEWCQALKDQAGDHICHSSGTSGVVGLLNRSARDGAAQADAMLWHYQPFGGDLQYHPGEPNDVVFAAPQPRRQFRVPTQYADNLGQRYGMPVLMLPAYFGPEHFIAQGKVRQAQRHGTLDRLDDPIVASHGREVTAYQDALPGLLEDWSRQLLETYVGRRVIVQMTSDIAWRLTQILRARGVRGAFAPGSVYSLGGGVKDGNPLPDDWLDQFRDVFGADDDSFCSLYGMSEVNAQVRQCPAGMYHATPFIIPFVLDVVTGTPLPRTGVQTGRFAVLELLSIDSWGGLITDDRATIIWDAPCACGAVGPLIDPRSIGRL